MIKSTIILPVFNCYTSISPAFHLHFTSISPALHLHFTSISPAFHLHFTSISPAFYQYFTCILPVFHLHWIILLVFDLQWTVKCSVSNNAQGDIEVSECFYGQLNIFNKSFSTVIILMMITLNLHCVLWLNFLFISLPIILFYQTNIIKKKYHFGQTNSNQLKINCSTDKFIIDIVYFEIS